MPCRWILFGSACLLALILPGWASAHVRLVRSVPADRAVVDTAPARVKVVFDDTVRPSSGIRVIRNGDGSVLGGKPHVVSGRTLVIPLRSGLADGDYSVLWRVLSNDGHTAAGVLAFGVGTGRQPPQSALSADNGPGIQDVVSRFLFFAGLLTAVGLACFRFAVGAVGTRPLLGAFLLVFVGISGLAHDASVSTRFGTAMAAGAAVAGVGALLAAIAPVYKRLGALAFVTALLLLPLPTLAGHSLDRGRGALEPIVDVLHVAAASVWLGGLVALGLALVEAGDRAALVRRFSNIALTSVLVLALTGVIRALTELRAVSQIWSTGYGRVLIVKSALLTLLVALGWVNRYRLIPRSSFGSLRRTVAVELVLFAALAAAVGLLTDLRPGRDRAAAAVTPPLTGPPPPPAAGMVVQARQSGNLAVALAVRPPGAELVALGPDGEGVNGLSVQIAGRTARSCGNGCYGSFGEFAGKVVRVVVDGRALRFDIPATARPADRLLERATAAFRRLRTVDYVERLASSPRARVVADFTLERPDRLMYTIHGGADGIVIGARRWDRVPGGKWVPSQQDRTPQPEPIWSGHFTNAYVLKATPATYVVSFFKPVGPVWFTIALDRSTLLPRTLRMTAAAHFMTHRYTSFNAPRRIEPPPRG